MSLAARVIATIRKHQMLPRGGRVLVALSGGPDSVALVHLLRELEQQGELVLAGVAHFNHQLRGAAADADEAFCRDLADRLAVPIDVDRADVRTIAHDEGHSIEDTARRLRYLFLEAARVRLNAESIATGHSLDDQAETFLLRLVRGAGTRGLGSIRPKAGRVIRPLIEIRREPLRHYATANGLCFQEDATNQDVSIPRNRVRHELLPYLERQFTPGIAEVLAREAALARQDDERLQIEAIEMTASVVLSDTGSITLDTAALSRLHPSLASRVAARALQALAGARFVGYDHVARLLAFAAAARPGQTLSLPGQQAVHRGETITLRPAPPRHVEPPENFSSVQLSVPGEVVLGDWVVSAELSDTADRRRTQGGPEADLVVVDSPLAVRFRRPGDRFEPPGMGGRQKKLQDYFVDRKVERSERDRLPLVVDDSDRIVWVVGHGVAEGRRAPGPAPGVILLQARRLGGEG